MDGWMGRSRRALSSRCGEVWRRASLRRRLLTLFDFCLGLWGKAEWAGLAWTGLWCAYVSVKCVCSFASLLVLFVRSPHTVLRISCLSSERWIGVWQDPFSTSLLGVQAQTGGGSKHTPLLLFLCMCVPFSSVPFSIYPYSTLCTVPSSFYSSSAELSPSNVHYVIKSIEKHKRRPASVPCTNAIPNPT